MTKAESSRALQGRYHRIAVGSVVGSTDSLPYLNELGAANRCATITTTHTLKRVGEWLSGSAEALVAGRGRRGRPCQPQRRADAPRAMDARRRSRMGSADWKKRSGAAGGPVGREDRQDHAALRQRHGLRAGATQAVPVDSTRRLVEWADLVLVRATAALTAHGDLRWSEMGPRALRPPPVAYSRPLYRAKAPWRSTARLAIASESGPQDLMFPAGAVQGRTRDVCRK